MLTGKIPLKIVIKGVMPKVVSELGKPGKGREFLDRGERNTVY